MDGIILDNIRNKTEIKLPKSKGIVWIWDDILAGEMLGGLQVDNLGQPERTNILKIIMSIIADWNFIDKEGTKLEINEENVKKLPIKDFQVLTEKINNLTQKSSISSEEKKI